MGKAKSKGNEGKEYKDREDITIPIEIEKISDCVEVEAFHEFLYDLIKLNPWRGIIDCEKFNPVFAQYHLAMASALKGEFALAKNEIYKAIAKVYEITVKYLNEIFENFYNRCFVVGISLEGFESYNKRLVCLNKIRELEDFYTFNSEYTELFSWINEKIKELTPSIEVREKMKKEFEERYEKINKLKHHGDELIRVTMGIMLEIMKNALANFPKEIDHIDEVFRSVECLVKEIDKKEGSIEIS